VRSNSLTFSARSTAATCWEIPDCVAFSSLRRSGERTFLAHRNDGADLPQRDRRHDCLKIGVLEKMMTERRIYYFGFRCQPA
jgi:hypothetical protein